MITNIMIISHYKCNFSCSYCNQREIATSDKLNYLDVYNFIFWLYQNNHLNNEINIQFEGGETLIRWKDFIVPLVNKLKSLPLKFKYSLFTVFYTVSGV